MLDGDPPITEAGDYVAPIEPGLVVQVKYFGRHNGGAIRDGVLGSNRIWRLRNGDLRKSVFERGEFSAALLGCFSRGLAQTPSPHRELPLVIIPRRSPSAFFFRISCGSPFAFGFVAFELPFGSPLRVGHVRLRHCALRIIP
jgi:hypothetical protein